MFRSDRSRRGTASTEHTKETFLWVAARLQELAKAATAASLGRHGTSPPARQRRPSQPNALVQKDVHNNPAGDLNVRASVAWQRRHCLAARVELGDSVGWPGRSDRTLSKSRAAAAFSGSLRVFFARAASPCSGRLCTFSFTNRSNMSGYPRERSLCVEQSLPGR